MHFATRRLSVLGLRAAAAARRPAPSWPAAARRRCSGRPHLAEVETADATSDLGWLIDMVQFGAFVTIVNGYVLSMTQCIGPSMKPTLTTAGDIVLLWPAPMVRLLHGGPQRGDVVISTSPVDPSQSVCKRVVGMPGDTVRVPASPWAMRDSDAPGREVVVPRGQVWLHGDNQSDSTDSRHYGAVPIALIQGVVFARIYSSPCWIRRCMPPPGQTTSPLVEQPSTPAPAAAVPVEAAAPPPPVEPSQPAQPHEPPPTADGHATATNEVALAPEPEAAPTAPPMAASTVAIVPAQAPSPRDAREAETNDVREKAAMLHAARAELERQQAEIARLREEAEAGDDEGTSSSHS